MRWLMVLVAAFQMVAFGCPESSPDGHQEVIGGDDVGSDVAPVADSLDKTRDADAGDGSPDVSVAADYAAAGPFAVGQTTLMWEDTDRARTLTVELWYPAEEAGEGGTLESFEPVPPNSATLDSLLAAAPQGCVNPVTTASRDASPGSVGGWPLIVMSHCHNCTRFSTFSVAERLASHGFAVVAPDHVDNTLWDAQDGTAVELGADFLVVRGADVRFVLDVLLDGADERVPADLRGRFDSDRVGAVGHSFGSVTAGYAAQFDPRVRAVAGLAAPMENPVIAGVTMAEIKVPVLFMVMVEDNSISEFGNILLRDNFANANAPAWKVELDDAGHWSVSDICGLVPDFEACCGDAERQTDGTPFTYLPVATGREVTQNTVTAFFARYLLEDVEAEAVLSAPWPTGVSVEAR